VIDLDFALNGEGSVMELVLSSRSLRYARAVFFLNGKGSAMEHVLSSRSLRYARAVFTMEGKE
jgi:hypothetical protein